MTLAAILLSAGFSWAHFQTLVPTQDVLVGDGQRSVDFDIRFTHPMEGGPVMKMGTPAIFGVVMGTERKDLLPSLEAVSLRGRSAYRARYRFDRPGDHVFFFEPAPYWEPAEGKMIIHYTKVVVNAFGGEGGWDQLVGFPVEIEPLVRPYGVWTGNCFRGIVRRDGKPVPFARVEVEYLNHRESSIQLPAPAFSTQVIKTDGKGVFSYTMPRAGWWGFAALVDGDSTLANPKGKQVAVELGGLLWVRTVAMRERPSRVPTGEDR
ncbi:MAG: DUF4198 domain-containing protein [Planctomycetota bacterium]|jgi:cobalt/nickel transport protein